jgi:hypothetical protein
VPKDADVLVIIDAALDLSSLARFGRRLKALDWPCVRQPTLFKIRHIALHPPQDRRMSQQDAALGHHLDQVTGTELESEIPSHTQNDDLLVKVPSLEQPCAEVGSV